MSAEDSPGVDKIKQLINSLKHRTIRSSSVLALQTFKAFCNLIENTTFFHPKQLISILREWISQVSENCRPHAIIAENVALRILRIVNDVNQESFNNIVEINEEDSLHLLLRGKLRQRNPSISHDIEPKINNEHLANFKSILYEELETYRNEIETSSEDIGRQALQHIHSNETIMVYGHSKIIECFLKTAAKSRKFRLIVAEGSPKQKGHRIAQNMASTGIDITLIPDSAIFAIMARVNKVIIGTCVISADGSLSAHAGINALALSAFHHGVPVLVCEGLYKLSPRYTHVSSVSGRDIDYSYPVCPDLILDYETAGSIGDVEVLNPSYDQVPANLVTLFITNVGAQSPSYMYHIIKEIYHPSDIFIFD